MLIGAAHRDLREQREVHVVIRRAEILDLGVAAGLLFLEIVGREAEHFQPLAALVLIQLFQPFVLRRQTALRRHVDDQQHLALERRSEEHTSELQSLMRISYAVFCLKKKNTHQNKNTLHQTTTISSQLYRH